MRKFESVAEYVEYMNVTPRNPKFDRYESEDTSTRNVRFTGTKSWQEAQSLMDNGDKKIAKELINRKDEVSPKVKHLVRELINKREKSVVGAIPSVAAFLNGNPRNMIRRKRQSAETKIVNIVYINSISCGIDKEDMIKVGINVLYCLNEFEKAGYRVNLYVGAATWVESNQKKAWGYVVNVKNSGQYVNIEKLAYLLANPSAIRRHSFRMMEVESETVFSNYYGWRMNEKDVITSLLEKVSINNANVVTFYDLQHKDIKETSKLLSGNKL